MIRPAFERADARPKRPQVERLGERLGQRTALSEPSVRLTRQMVRTETGAADGLIGPHVVTPSRGVRRLIEGDVCG